MGNTEFDQYQLRYAQSIGKKPSELTFAEMQKVLQQYAKRQAQTPGAARGHPEPQGKPGTLAKAQVAAMPTDAELEAEARDYRNLDMPPSRLAAMREGRIQYFPQLLEKARAQAAAEGKPFSPADLEQRYDVRTETEKAFTGDGAQAQKISGFENLMRHTGLLWKANDALAKNDFPLMRQIANAVGSKVGSDAKTTYDMISTFVSDEAAKTFLPGGGGEGERAKTLAHVSSDLGAAQTKTNLKNLMELADSQRQTLERQYTEGTFGKGTRSGRLFSPDALANRDMVMGKKPAAAAAPGQQQQLQYVKRAVGPNNHAIGQTSDGKWHDIRIGSSNTVSPEGTEQELPPPPAGYKVIDEGPAPAAAGAAPQLPPPPTGYKVIDEGGAGNMLDPIGYRDGMPVYRVDVYNEPVFKGRDESGRPILGLPPAPAAPPISRGLTTEGAAEDAQEPARLNPRTGQPMKDMPMGSIPFVDAPYTGLMDASYGWDRLTGSKAPRFSPEWRHDVAGGSSQVIRGGLEALMPLLPGALIEAPLTTALTLAAGSGMSGASEATPGTRWESRRNTLLWRVTLSGSGAGWAHSRLQTLAAVPLMREANELKARLEEATTRAKDPNATDGERAAAKAQVDSLLDRVDRAQAAYRRRAPLNQPRRTKRGARVRSTASA